MPTTDVNVPADAWTEVGNTECLVTGTDNFFYRYSATAPTGTGIGHFRFAQTDLRAVPGEGESVWVYSPQRPFRVSVTPA